MSPSPQKSHATTTGIRPSRAPTQPKSAAARLYRLAPIGWCSGHSTPSTAVSQPLSETPERGLCFRGHPTRIYIFAARLGMATNTLLETRRSGQCSTPKLVPRCELPTTQLYWVETPIIGSPEAHHLPQAFECSMFSLDVAVGDSHETDHVDNADAAPSLTDSACFRVCP